MSPTPGTWGVRRPYGRCKRPAITAPGVRSVCTVNKIEDAHLISAAPEMYFITRLVASIPMPIEGMEDDYVFFSIDKFGITAGDVRAARRVLDKAGGNA